MPSASIINRLTPATIHKIAAGEVIERPANVVKELVENALDAGATKIVVAIEDGGLDLIRVSDNGKGMVRDDVMVAWHPHTTSKIREVGDLQSVITYGFRGEALCSMAAVAELTLETRHASEATGMSVTISDSRETDMREISRNPGTTVTVRNLFLHNPARRKFMGSGKNEAARILNMVSRIALAHPGTGFRVSDRGREMLALAEGTLKNRVGEVLGFNITNDLVPVEWSDSTMHVEGFVCTPQQARLRSTHQYFFINRRSIQSGLISRALSQSYDALPPGRFPMAVLFLTMPTEEVDVNVHPTKKEVRFLNESRIHWAVGQSVKSALRRMVEAPTLDLGGGLGPVRDPVSADSAPAPFVYAKPFHPSGVPESQVFESGGDDESPPAAANQIRLFPADARRHPQAPARSFSEAAPRAEAALKSEAALRLDTTLRSETAPRSEAAPRPISSDTQKPRAPEVPFLQLHNGFILFGVESGLMMVNQQAAHERILYEKAMEESRQAGRFSSQQLLFPEVLELPPGDSLFLEEHLDRLQALGFDLESFGGNTFQLRGLPMEVRPDQARRVVHEMVQGLMRPERAAGPPKSEDFQHRLAKVYARVTSVKLGEHLEHAQAAALIDGLFATQNPYVSPSGAPIVARFSLEEIHRKFGLKT
jgi:DNA mismatch repair protein MutL